MGVRVPVFSFSRLITIVLSAYWLVIFTATHLSPGAVQEFDVEGSDKLKHYIAYAGLAFLLALRSSCHARLTGRTLAWLLVAGAAYGAFDEITQEMVGREGELGDWVADVIGLVTGLAAFALIWAALDRRRTVADG